MIKKILIFILSFLLLILSSLILSYGFEDKVIELQVGESVDLMALLVEDNTIRGLATAVWESGNTDVVTISSNGVITGKTTGRTHVSVTVSEGDKTSTAMVFISVNPGVESVSFGDDKISIVIGEAYTPSYKLKPYKGISKLFNEEVKFFSSDNSIVKIGSNNTIIGVKPGNTKVYVFTEDGYKHDYLDVEVVHGYKDIIISNINMNQQFYVGEKIKLDLTDQDGRKLVSDVRIYTTTVQPYYGHDPNEGKSILEGPNMNILPSKERLTLPSATAIRSGGVIEFISPGQVRIDVETIGERKAAVVIDVNTMIKEINLDEVSITFDEIGSDKLVGYNIVPEIEGVEPLIKDVIWRSSNTDIVTVTSDGVITSRGVGYAQISIETVDGHFKDSIAVEVKGEKKNIVRVTSIIVKPTKDDVYVGERVPLEVSIIPENAENKQIDFVVGNGLGSIKKEGEVYYFTGIKEGKTKVKCTSATGPTTEFDIEVKSILAGIDMTSSLTEEKNRKIIYLGQESEIEVDIKAKAGYSVDELYEKGYTVSTANGAIAVSNQKDNTFKITGSKLGIDTLKVKTKDSGKEKIMLFEVQSLVSKIKIENKDIFASIGEKVIPEVTFEVKNNIYGFDLPKNDDYSMVITDSYILREYIIGEIKYENESIKEMRLLLEKNREKYLSLLSEIRYREERIKSLQKVLSTNNSNYIRITGSDIKDRTGKTIVLGTVIDKSITGNYKGYVVYKVTSKDGEKIDTGKITFNAEGKDIILVKDGKIISSSDENIEKNISEYEKLLLDNDVLEIIYDKYKSISTDYKPDKDHILYIIALEKNIETLNTQKSTLFRKESTKEDVLILMIKIIEKLTETSRSNPPNAVFKDDENLIGTKAYNLGIIGMNPDRIYDGNEVITQESLEKVISNTIKSIKVISGGKVNIERELNIVKEDNKYFTNEKTITNQSLQKMIYIKLYNDQITKKLLQQ